ncbi:hypothetical protein DFH11DRAFT_1625319, partial [Phellopilus nigrolimitatus]
MRLDEYTQRAQRGFPGSPAEEFGHAKDYALLVRDICWRKYDTVLQEIGEESMHSQEGHAHVELWLQEAVSITEENLRAAEEALAETRAHAPTGDAMQEANTAVENAKHELDGALWCIGDECMSSPEGRARVNPGLLKELDEAEKTVQYAEGMAEDMRFFEFLASLATS